MITVLHLQQSFNEALHCDIVEIKTFDFFFRFKNESSLLSVCIGLRKQSYQL